MSEVSTEKLIEYARLVLENPFWIPELNDDDYYERLHDDHDETFKGKIIVCFDQFGDIRIGTDKDRHWLRFRNSGGGGMSLRVRNAIMILALAIKLDNEEHPIEEPQKE